MNCSGLLDTLYLEVENKNVRAGEELTGLVHLRLDQGIQATCLSFVFEGNESCRWTEDVFVGDEDGYYSHRTYEGHVEVVREEFLVFEFAAGFVEPGHFSFPFVYPVPSHIPGTFHFKDPSASADIQYSLTASAGYMTSARENIHVSQRPRPLSSLTSARVTSMFLCCYVNEGTVEMQAEFIQNSDVPGETAELVVTVINNSRLNISSLFGHLEGILRLNDNRGNASTRPLYYSSLRQFQEIPAGTITIGEQRIRFKPSTLCFREQLLETPSVNGTLIESAQTFWVNAELVPTWKITFLSGVPWIEQIVWLDPLQLLDLQAPDISLDLHSRVI